MRDVGLVGKIDGRFDQHSRLDQLTPPALVERGKLTRCLTQRLAPLGIGVGIDQVDDAFGSREIELAVVERASGEFAGGGGPTSWNRC